MENNEKVFPNFDPTQDLSQIWETKEDETRIRNQTTFRIRD